MRWTLIFAIAAAGCLRQTEFQCRNNSSCGGQGTCETSRYCSFPDTDCASGRRYSSSAGSLSEQCVPGGSSIDGGVDSIGPPDSRVDAPPAGCPSGYNALPGITTHLYKLVTIATNWQTQQQGCRLTTTSAYLAVPDDATELMALDTLAGGAANYWVGITDSATEGTWLNVLGAPQTFLPWQPPAPDNNAGGPGEDCVEAITALHMFNDVRCNTSLPAICECNN